MNTAVKIGFPKITGRRGSPSRRLPGHVLVSAGGIAKPPMVPEGGLKDAPRTVWGHAAVTGRLNVASMAQFATETILGALTAAAKGGPGAMIETLAKMASRSIVSVFEEELRRARIEAYQEGYKAGMAEGIARDRAAQRAAAGAVTIFPKAEHYLRKQDQEAGAELAKTMAEYHGTTLAGPEETENIAPRPVRSISGWVQAAGLVQGMLGIQFKGGKSGPVVCIYPGSSRAAMEDLLAAPSAGKWVHSHVYGAQYFLDQFSVK